ncbi:MAG: hypothetical protein JWP34_3114, partial [Massilia sp.]|nr:hypothetical protein [Massilia sp.]
MLYLETFPLAAGSLYNHEQMTNKTNNTTPAALARSDFARDFLWG